jgi:hypothetical protein
VQLRLRDVRQPLAQHGGDDVLEGVRLQLELVAHHAPQVEHHAAHHVQVAGVVAPCTEPPSPQLMATRFAASLPTDNCPQPKEALLLYHALTSD